jgi:pimeloyl-ACP methyl ester carboxylesterase
MDVGELPRTVVTTDDGARLAVALLGEVEDRDRPLAVLQHGFPDSPATWRHLAPALVATGHRVAMPWLRGYLPSRRGRQAPSIRRYADDLVAVHDQLHGGPDAVLVGHDWGALAAWDAAMRRSWRAVVGLAVPPEPALHGFLLDLDQLWRSRYQFQAQLPIAGWVLRERLRPLVDLWLRWSPRYVPTSHDLAPLRRALATTTAVRAALAPYRAAAVPGLLGRTPAADGPVPQQPALLVHGAEDGCIDRRYATAARPLLGAAHPTSTVWLVPDGGHFVHLEQPALVNDAVLSFLSRSSSARR